MEVELIRCVTWLQDPSPWCVNNTAMQSIKVTDTFIQEMCGYMYLFLDWAPFLLLRPQPENFLLLYIIL